MSERDQIRSTSDQDAAIESALLQQVLALHPTAITIAELKRELIGDEGSFSCDDAVERAVRDLAAVGLLQRSNAFVLPTRAALRFDQLLER